MIKIRELKEKSSQWGISIETVDKDWVLGQLLNGMYQQRFFVDNLIFKGGTCIKKLYFHEYRFSEDIDFSSKVVIEKQEVM